MVWNWIFKRLLTPERVTDLIKNNQEVISAAMKDSIQDVLEDEEIGKMVITYTDSIYARYLGKSGKFWSSMGGMTKGFNAAMGEEVDNLNPFSGFIDEEGEFSLSGIVKGVLRQAMSPTQQKQQTQPKLGVVPNM